MKIRTRSVIMGILSAFLLSAVSLAETYAESPAQIWSGKAEVYIGYGSTFNPETGMLTCKLYNMSGRPLSVRDDGVEGVATFNLKDFPEKVMGTFDLSGLGRDVVDVELLAENEVQALDPILQQFSAGKPINGKFMLLAGEHKTKDGSTLIHRCKIQVLDSDNDGKPDGFFCHYNVFMIVKNIV